MGHLKLCEAALYIGKNPWQSHGFARARVLLREMPKGPNSALIGIDPRRRKTAETADYQLATKPGTDTWSIARLLGIPGTGKTPP